MSRSAVPASVRGLRHLLIEQRRQEESDEQLLHDFLARGDESAFAALVRRHGPMVRNVCLRVLNHVQDAEDAYQATFLLLARKAVVLRNRAALAGWLHGAAYRTALKAKQSAARRRKHEARTPPRTVDNPARELLWREVQALLDEEIGLLPEIYRSVFVFCCLENLSRAETARRLGLKEGTISSRLAEARKRLQQRLARRGVELTALLAATALTTQAVSALPPVSLARMSGPALSPSIAALADSSPSILRFGKIKLAAGLLLAVSVLAGAAACGLALSRKRPAQPPSAPSSDKPRTAPPKREAAQTIEIEGCVLGTDGKPKAGAKLLLLDRKGNVKQLGVAAANGRFAVAVGKETTTHDGHWLLAEADGTGLDFLKLYRLKLGKPVELRLVKDNPIRGRVVNTEGKPVAGVRVTVKRLDLYPGNSLDAFLAGWKERHFLKGIASGEKYLRTAEAALGAVATDAEGRFALHGVGEERLVYLRLWGGGIAEEQRLVVNRAGFDAKPYNRATRDNIPKEARPSIVPMLLHGPDVSVVAEAEKPIRGVVKEADTGKGRAGVVVRILGGQSLQAKTDARGRYEIRGARKRKTYVLEVASDSSTGHMTAQARADDTPGYRPIVADISVKKGVIVTGKVIDKSTGKPISGSAMAAVLINNPFVRDYPRFDSPAWLPIWETAKDGVFRVVTLPGPVLLMGGPNDYETGFLYKPPNPDPKYPQYFKKLASSSYYYGPNGVMLLLQGNYCKVLEIKADAKIVEQDIVLERASTLPVHLQDAEGQPLSGVWAAGIRPEGGHPAIQCKEAGCTVYRLEPGKPRLLVFFDPARKRAGTLRLQGDEKLPMVAKLGPTGAIRGRLLDADGKPLAGVAVDVHYRDRETENIHKIIQEAKQTVTDATGAFALDELIPALKFELWFHRGKHRFERTAKPVEPTFEVKSGEKRDAGAIELQRVAERTEE